MVADDFTGTILDLKEEIYHAHPALSSTQAKAINKTGQHYQYMLKHPRAPKREFDLGSAVHAKVLGTGYGVQEIEFDNWRTNAAKEAAEEARTAGLIPMLTKDLVERDAIAEAVLAHPTARTLLERDGAAEVSMFGQDPETGVHVRCRWDFLPNPHPTLPRVAVDLKTARGGGASLHEAASASASYGYYLSRSHYRDTSVFAGDPVDEMVFLFVETEPPYLVAQIHLNEQFQEIGDYYAARARRRLAAYRRDDSWPGYPLSIQSAAPPAWLTYQYLDEQNADYEENRHTAH